LTKSRGFNVYPRGHQELRDQEIPERNKFVSSKNRRGSSFGVAGQNLQKRRFSTQWKRKALKTLKDVWRSTQKTRHGLELSREDAGIRVITIGKGIKKPK